MQRSYLYLTICNLFFFSLIPHSLAEIFSFSYLNPHNICTVLAKKVVGTHKLHLTNLECAQSQIQSLVRYEFQKDHVAAYFESEKMILNYGDRLEWTGEKLVHLKHDQVFQYNSKLTARNDEYVDFCNGHFQILDKHEICLQGNKHIWGTLNQSEYYQILYFDLKKYTHSLVDALDPGTGGFNHHKNHLMNITNKLDQDENSQVLMCKLKLLIDHHYKKTQYSLKKFHNFRGLTKKLHLYEKYLQDVLSLLFARQCGPDRA